MRFFCRPKRSDPNSNPDCSFDGPGARTSSGIEISGSAMAVIAMIVGLVVTMRYGNAAAIFDAVDRLTGYLDSFTQKTVVLDAEALVVTASSASLLTVVSTLSPRGFHCLVAGSAGEALGKIEANRSAIKLAVVDGGLRDYRLLVKALKETLPGNRIIVLQGGRRTEDVSSMLLERVSTMATEQ